MLDADLHRFEADGLNQTKSGLRLRLAVHEGRIAVAQIRGGLVGPRRLSAAALETWRQSYIRASNCAAQAIDELWNDYQWPPDAGRERRYTWQPPALKR